MLNDPLYLQIRRRLRELSNGILFEACANDLLQKIHPALAPREGGSDAGLDGLIASASGTVIQLICTVGQDVIGNLTRSIASNQSSGGTASACILATSQRLSNSKKRKIEERGIQLGRSVLQIYDQAAFAQLLYRDARWLKELLGLIGTPPAISVFPLTTRSFVDGPLIGRDEVIDQFPFPGDKVLVGQPGSGKTHVLFTAAKKGKGRFIIEDDLTAIANGLREVNPKFVIVDDAHSRIELLKRIVHLRRQLGADFRVVASCWPGQEDAVSAALQITKRDCLPLDGLTQKEIKQVIHAQKIFGPPELLFELIHQSQGKPGLAVTLCRLCLEVGTKDVVFGSALAQDTKRSIEPVLGAHATEVVACLSLGGDAGMSLEAAAKLTSRTVLETKRIVESLAAAGILEVSREQTIAVYPFRLRQAFVRDFFLRPPLIDLKPYLAETPNFEAATRVLIQGKALGGIVSDEFIRSRLASLGDEGGDAFVDYVSLGRAEAEWVLQQYPGKTNLVARAALSTAPEKAIYQLLTRAATERIEKPIVSTEHLNQIKTWVFAAHPASEEAFTRRQLVAETAAQWFEAHQSVHVAISVALLPISIEHENSSSPPGEPMVMTLHRGVVIQDHLERVASLWPLVRPILKRAPIELGQHVAHVFHAWIYPTFHLPDLAPEYAAASRRLAIAMISEVLGELQHWTVHHHFRRYADVLGIGDRIRTDPIADVVYPAWQDSEDFEVLERERSRKADALGKKLRKCGPEEAIGLLIKIEREATAAQVNESSRAPAICKSIVDGVFDLRPWIEVLLKLDSPAHLAAPFLERMVTTDPEYVEDWIVTAIEREHLVLLCVNLAVRFYSPESRAWKVAGSKFKNFHQNVGTLAGRNDISNSALRTLLTWPDSEVAESVAINLWQKRRAAPSDCEEEWNAAIVNCTGLHQQHWLQEIFRHRPPLAFSWLQKRLEHIRNGGGPLWYVSRHDHAFKIAVSLLTFEQRRELLTNLPAKYGLSDFLRVVVARDRKLFMHVLSQEQLGDVRLAPLRLGPFDDEFPFKIDEQWCELAILAMEYDFSPEAVFSESQGWGGSWSGPTSEMYEKKRLVYEPLLQNKTPRLKQIGVVANQFFTEQRDAHLIAERRAAIRGEIA